MPDKSSDQEFQDRLRQLQAFMNNSPAAAFMKDDGGRYVYFSERMASMFYAPLSDLEGKTDFDWLPEYLASQIWTSDQLVLSTGEPLELIQTVPAADGKLLYWLVFKFPFTNARGQKFVGGVAVDITQLKEIEARLSASEQRYRRLVESSQGLICSHDMEGLVLSVNTAACNALGYESNEIIGRNFRDFLKPGADEQFDEYLKRIDQNSIDEGVMMLLTKAGRKIIITVTEGKRVKFSKTEQVGLIGEGGKYYVPVFLYSSMCSDVQITAKLSGQKTPSTMTRKVPFLCGE